MGCNIRVGLGLRKDRVEDDKVEELAHWVSLSTNCRETFCRN